MVTSARGEATPRREKRGDDAVGLVRILLDRKMKKIYVVDSTVTNGCQRFKAMMSYFFKKNICKWDIVLFISSHKTQL
jgi:hypothetical protein